MRKFLFAMVGILLVASMAMAAPMCSGPTSVTSLGATGCFIGATLFSNFSISGANVIGKPASAVDPNSVLVNISYSSPVFTVATTPTTATDWQLTSNQQFSFVLTYTVTAGGSDFASYQSAVSFSNQSGTGSISLVKSVSSGSTGSAGADQVNPTSAVFAFSPSQSTFVVTDNIQANGGTNGTVNALSFTNVFTTPEPATTMLIGSGLLSLAMFLRRRR